MKKYILSYFTVAFLCTSMFSMCNDNPSKSNIPTTGNTTLDGAIAIVALAGFLAKPIVSWFGFKEKECEYKQEIRDLKHEKDTLALRNDNLETQKQHLANNAELQKLKAAQMKEKYKQCLLQLNELECRLKDEFVPLQKELYLACLQKHTEAECKQKFKFLQNASNLSEGARV